MKIERVLCPVDFSEFSRRALHHAEAIASWYEAELHVLHLLPPVVPPLAPMAMAVAPQGVGDAEPARRSLTEFVEKSGVARETTRVVREGPVVSGIVDYAAEMSADLIVLGTHGYTGFDRMLLGSTTEHVLHKAACPVLTVPPAADEPGSAERVRFTHVLCAVDFSPASMRALEHGLSLAEENAARLTVLHVIETLSDEEVREQAHFRVGEYVQARTEEALRQLQAAVPDEARTWCEVAEVVALGRPDRVILREAEARRADLIVMGSQGRGVAGLRLFGSTTQNVPRHAGCPVLTARPRPAAKDLNAPARQADAAE